MQQYKVDSCQRKHVTSRVDVTSRVIKGKMLIFSKVSDVYNLIDVFCFCTEKVKMTYDQHYILTCHLYLNITYTDSCSMFFNFICKDICNVKESESRKVIFEIWKQSKITKRLNLSDKFWQHFEMQNENTRKVMGLYEIENIDNANICTITVNPKEYFEKLKNRSIN